MTSAAGSTLPPLSVQYDDLISCTNVLLPGTEGVFAQFVGSKISLCSKLSTLSDENKKMKSKNEALQIQLEHSRSTHDYQMQKKMEAEENLRQYEKQFTIILELLGDNKLKTLSDRERQSLALLKDGKDGKGSYSPLQSFLTESSAMVSLSDLSMDPDLDEDTSILRDGKKWKRRRTASTDKVIKAVSPPNKKKRSNDGKASPPAPPKEQVPPPVPPQGPSQSPLSPIVESELNKAPPLDQRFKRPPPDKKKRRPSKSHLKQLASPTRDDLDDMTQELLPLEEGKEEVEEEEPAPSAPPFSPRIYPILPKNSSDLLGSPQVDGVVTPTSATPTCPASRSDFNMQRHHTFFLKTVIKLETINCGVCNKKIKFSKNCHKCRDCRTVCHPECKDQVPLPCIPSVPTPKKKQTSDLASHCPHSIPRVPGLVVHCVNEIERRGLDTLGLYRIPGSNKTIKEVKERILRGKGNPGMDKVSDVNVICGVLTSFLKSLREPILTFRMHPIFVKASECEMDEDCLASTLEAIAQLPPANKDTLAFLILHLQRVAKHCDANKMPLSSLAKIFGPTIVGHASANPKDTVILEDTKKQPLVMMKLLGIASEYWKQYMSEEDNPEPTATSPTPSGIASPGFKSPATPELRPVPESPFLGSCQSPRTKSFRNTLMQRPGGAARHSSVMTRGKRTGNFFARLD